MKNVLMVCVCVFSLFLTGCGSDEPTDALESGSGGTSVFQGEEFSISVPAKWNVISDESQILPKPKTGKIAFAATSNEVRYGFSSNMLVLSQHVKKPVTSLDFSVLNHVGSSKDFVDFVKLESKNIEFTDKDTSVVYIFEAKYNTDTPKLKYLQVGKVCYYTNAYLITIALPLDIKDTTRYEELLKTFTCKL